MSEKTHSDIDAMSFEQALAELEAIVSKLEKGEILSLIHISEPTRPY